MQPRDAQGRPVKQTSKGTPPAAQNAKNAPSQQAPAQAAQTTPATAPPAKDGGDKPIRTVGPTFIPAK
jgi:hypothetical protein